MASQLGLLEWITTREEPRRGCCFGGVGTGQDCLGTFPEAGAQKDDVITEGAGWLALSRWCFQNFAAGWLACEGITGAHTEPKAKGLVTSAEGE